MQKKTQFAAFIKESKRLGTLLAHLILSPILSLQVKTRRGSNMFTDSRSMIARALNIPLDSNDFVTPSYKQLTEERVNSLGINRIWEENHSFLPQANPFSSRFSRAVLKGVCKEIKDVMWIKAKNIPKRRSCGIRIGKPTDESVQNAIDFLELFLMSQLGKDDNKTTDRCLDSLKELEKANNNLHNRQAAKLNKKFFFNPLFRKIDKVVGASSVTTQEALSYKISEAENIILRYFT